MDCKIPLFPFDHVNFSTMAAQLNDVFRDGSDTSKGHPLSGGSGGPWVSSQNHAKPPYDLRQSTSATSQSSTNGLVQKKRHPPPSNKRAKEQLKAIQHLGFQSFEDTPVDYWEPRIEGEANPEFNARRQSECANLDAWIKRTKIQRRNPNDDKIDEEDLEADHSAMAAEHEVLQKRTGELERKIRIMNAELEKEKTAKISALQKIEEMKAATSSTGLKNDSLATKSSADTLNHTLQEAEKIAELLSSEKKLTKKLQAELQKEKTAREHLEAEVASLKCAVEKLQSAEGSSYPALGETVLAQLIQAMERKLNDKVNEVSEAIKDLIPALVQSQVEALLPPQVAVTPTEENGDFVYPRNYRKRHSRALTGQDNPRSDTRNGNETTSSKKSADHKESSPLVQERQHRPKPEKPQLHHPAFGFSNPWPRRGNPKAADPSEKKQKKNVPKDRPLPSKPVKDLPKKQQIEKILLIPENPADRAIRILQDNGVRARTAGILNVVEFGGGSALVVVEKSKAEALRQRLPSLHLKAKEKPALRKCSFRIHDVPIGESEEDIMEDLEARLRAAPSKVIKVPYRGKPDSGTVMVVVECDRELFDLVTGRTSIPIGYQRYRIDTSLQIMRCRDCGLYGHTRNHCPGLSVELKRLQSSSNKACLDCAAYNEKTKAAGLPRSRLRRTDHQPGDAACRTFGILVRKFRLARRTDPPTLAIEHP